MSSSNLNHQLGDEHLNPEEAVIHEREDLLRMAAKCKIHGQEELEDTDRSAGPRLYYAEILRRLRILNPRLAVLDGIEGNVALYRPLEPWEYDPEQWDEEKPDWFNQYKYVGGMAKNWLPNTAMCCWTPRIFPPVKFGVGVQFCWHSSRVERLRSKVQFNNSVTPAMTNGQAAGKNKFGSFVINQNRRMKVANEEKSVSMSELREILAAQAREMQPP